MVLASARPGARCADVAPGFAFGTSRPVTKIQALQRRPLCDGPLDQGNCLRGIEALGTSLGAGQDRTAPVEPD